MSWSVNFIGTPENITKALKAESEKLTGSSKTEYDACSQSLINLVSENYNHQGSDPVLHLQANGHSYLKDDQPQYGTCNVSLQILGGILV